MFNFNLWRALKRRMPTDAEMEAMGCRYLTAEELDAIFGGRPDDGDINDACPPGGNFGGGYSGGSSSGDSSDSGSSGSFSGDSSSADNGGQSGSSGNSSNSDNSSSKDYSIQPGDTLAGITHDHYPDLTGQDFVDKVNEIAAANGIDDIDSIQAGATISIPGGSGGSSSSGASGASGVGGGGNDHGGNDGEHGGATGTSGNANGKNGKGASGVGTSTTPATPSQAAQQQASGAKGAANGKGKSNGGFWSGVWNGLCAFGNGVKSFFNDPIGTAKGWFGGGATVSNNSVSLPSVQDKIADSIGNVSKENSKYTDTFQCDNFVQAVLEDAGFNSRNYMAGDASNKTVQNHIDDAVARGNATRNSKSSAPDLSSGSYVTYMNDSPMSYRAHAGIVEVAGSSVTFTHNSSNNSTGGIGSRDFTSLQDFQDWYDYDSFYYQEIR